MRLPVPRLGERTMTLEEWIEEVEAERPERAL